MDESGIRKELISLGERLRSIRKFRKLTQIELELKCGINNGDISRIENGQKNVEFITVLKLAASLDVSLRDLFDYEYSFYDRKDGSE